MDPQTTWEQMLEAVAHGNWGDAGERAEDLLSWLDADGFPPQTRSHKCAESDRRVATAMCHLILDHASLRGDYFP